MSYNWFGLSLVLSVNTMTLSQEARAEPTLYTVVEGNKVDENTLKGCRTWRALPCGRCHGAQQEGMVGPALVESLKRLPHKHFDQTLITPPAEPRIPNS